MIRGLFDGETIYTAELTLKPKAGYTFAGLTLVDLIGKFTVNGITNTEAGSSNSEGTVTVTIKFPRTEPATSVTAAPIEGIVAPVTGTSPVTTIPATDQYTATIEWWDTRAGAPFTGTAFAAGTPYEARITLMATGNYSFSGYTTSSVQGFKPADAASISLTAIGNATEYISVTITYPATAADESGSDGTGDDYTSGGGVDW